MLDEGDGLAGGDVVEVLGDRGVPRTVRVAWLRPVGWSSRFAMFLLKWISMSVTVLPVFWTWMPVNAGVFTSGQL